jgi:methionyl-tRNA formyltransferase
MKKVAFLNCIESGHELLTHLLKNGTKIDYIISLTPTQARDFNVSGYKDFSDISQQYNIPIYYPKKYNLSSKQDLEFFTQQNFDLMMVFGWQRLVPSNIINSLKIGALGAHGSSEPLPKGRGRSPINWSLIEGKTQFILHLFYIDPGVDSGDIIDFMKFDLNEWDTCHTSYHKVQICLRKMLLKNLDLILEGKVTPTKQDHSKATYYPKRTPKDGIIDWKKTTKEVYNLVRAVTKPYPGAFTPKKQVMIWKSQPFDSKISYPSAHPGEVIEVFNDKSFVIKTTDGSLYVTEYDSKKLIKIGDKL